MKKVLCLILSLVMLLSLVACSKKPVETQPTETTPVETTPTESTPVDTTPTAEPEKKPEDYKGTVMLYSSGAEDMQLGIKAAFEAEYPNVTLEYYFAGSGQIVTKLSTEMQTGAVECDVVWLASADSYVTWKNDGYLMKYDCPHLENVPVALKDGEDNYWTSYDVIIMGFGYAETLCTPEEAPKTWNVLTQPEWKDNFVMPDPNTAGSTKAAVWALVNHADYGWDYFQKLKDNNLGLESSTGNAENRVVSQSYKAGLGCDYRFKNLIDNGTPIGFNATEDVIAICPGPIAIPKDAPNPELAKLLYDWMMHPEKGQKLAAYEYNMTIVNTETVVPDWMTPASVLAEKAIAVDWNAMVVGVKDMLTKFDTMFKG